jgi:hypothetical protein
MKRRLIFAAAAVFALTCAIAIAPAKAATLLGNTISGSYHFPDQATVYGGSFSYTPNPFIVGAGPESVLDVEGVDISVDFGASSLVLTFVTEVQFNASAFNGPVFNVDSGNPFDPVSGVVASGGQSVTAFLSGGDLFVNWQDANFLVGETVTISFADTPVPLPAALPLFVTGLAGLGLLARRRKKQAA